MSNGSPPTADWLPPLWVEHAQYDYIAKDGTLIAQLRHVSDREGLFNVYVLGADGELHLMGEATAYLAREAVESLALRYHLMYVSWTANAMDADWYSRPA